MNVHIKSDKIYYYVTLLIEAMSYSCVIRKLAPDSASGIGCMGNCRRIELLFSLPLLRLHIASRRFSLT